MLNILAEFSKDLLERCQIQRIQICKTMAVGPVSMDQAKKVWVVGWEVERDI